MEISDLLSKETSPAAQIIDASTRQSVQLRARDMTDVHGGSPLFFLLSQSTSNIIPPWWSESRDARIREFWKRIDYLSGALYNMISKMTAIPWKIVPRDWSNRDDVRMAQEYTDLITYGSEYGSGWQEWYSKFLEDLLGQDNGGFSEIVGPGAPDGPLTGRPTTIAHLDASACRRTGNPTYPVVFTDEDGRQYKFHYTRILYSAQMPSPNRLMNGVGLCAISRCVNIAQTLFDILTYKMEKLGSRPRRGLGITQGGLSPDDLQDAVIRSDAISTSKGFSRYSELTFVGNMSLPEADLKLIELTSLPDGFDEETSVMLGMATVAMGFGVDARELFPAMSAGSTRADALLQHLKQRGKGPGQIIQTIEALFRQKFLPPNLTLVFDQQDDAEDQQVAEIRHIRSQARERDLNDGALDTRIARQHMLEDGELNQAQFETLELRDGRLADGTDILTLFYKLPILKFDNSTVVSDPLNVATEDPEYMLAEIAKKRSEVLKALATTDPSTSRGWQMVQANAALDKLQSLYEGARDLQAKQLQQQQFQQQQQQQDQPPGKVNRTDNSRSYPTRRKNPTAPNPKTELSTSATVTAGPRKR